MKTTYGIYVKGKGYLAIQGDTVWHQDTISGWAECIDPSYAISLEKTILKNQDYTIHIKGENK